MQVKYGLGGGNTARAIFLLSTCDEKKTLPTSELNDRRENFGNIFLAKCSILASVWGIHGTFSGDLLPNTYALYRAGLKSGP